MKRFIVVPILKFKLNEEFVEEEITFRYYLCLISLVERLIHRGIVLDIKPRKIRPWFERFNVPVKIWLRGSKKPPKGSTDSKLLSLLGERGRTLTKYTLRYRGYISWNEHKIFLYHARRGRIIIPILELQAEDLDETFSILSDIIDDADIEFDEIFEEIILDKKNIRILEISSKNSLRELGEAVSEIIESTEDCWANLSSKLAMEVFEEILGGRRLAEYLEQELKYELATGRIETILEAKSVIDDLRRYASKKLRSKSRYAKEIQDEIRRALRYITAELDRQIETFELANVYYNMWFAVTMLIIEVLIFSFWLFTDLITRFGLRNAILILALLGSLSVVLSWGLMKILKRKSFRFMRK